MRYYPITAFVCAKCEKELLLTNQVVNPITLRVICVQCAYFESIGVITVTDYNNWLQGNWLNKGNK